MNKAKIYNNPMVEDILKDISKIEFRKVESKMLLATIIDDGIKAKGWKKSDFAKMMQKKPSEISKWLSGTHNFTHDTLIEIENILDVKLTLAEKKAVVISKTYVIQVSSPAGLSYADFGSQCISDNSKKHSYSFKN